MSWMHVTRDGDVWCIGAECVICKARNAAALAAAPEGAGDNADRANAESFDIDQLATSEGARRKLDRMLWATEGNRSWPEIVSAVGTLQSGYAAIEKLLKAAKESHQHKWRNCWDDGRQNTRCERCGISIATLAAMNGGKCP